MKVIFNGKNNETKLKATKEIKCECSSIFEYDDDDIQIEHGEAFVECPICGKKNYTEDFAPIDNATYPNSFIRCCEPLFENGVPISDGAKYSSDSELNKEFQRFKQSLRNYIDSCGDEPPYIYYSASGDWFFLATRDDDDNAWEIFVMQDYYSNWFYV